jgi:hypothetical protein
MLAHKDVAEMFWKTKSEDCVACVAACRACALTAKKAHGHVIQLPSKPERPLQRFQLDAVELIETDDESKGFFDLIDLFSKKSYQERSNIVFLLLESHFFEHTSIRQGQRRFLSGQCATLVSTA